MSATRSAATFTLFTSLKSNNLYTKIDAGIDPSELVSTEQIEPVTTSEEQPF